MEKTLDILVDEIERHIQNETRISREEQFRYVLGRLTINQWSRKENRACQNGEVFDKIWAALRTFLNTEGL